MPGFSHQDELDPVEALPKATPAGTSERTDLHVKGRTQALMSTNKPSAKLRTAARLAQSCKEWGDCLLPQRPPMETARSRP